jgi:DUF1365 family protein
MRSCLYEGVVQHRRLDPVEHAFRYQLFLVYVDLAELYSLFGRRGVWSTRWPALARFRRDDYLGDPALPLDNCVRDLVEKRIGHRPAGPIGLLSGPSGGAGGFGMSATTLYQWRGISDSSSDVFTSDIVLASSRRRDSAPGSS